MRAATVVFGLILLGCGEIVSAQSSEDPISAIDWLTESLSDPSGVAGGQEPVTPGIVTEQISVQPLNAPSPDGVGLLPRSVTGLPANLWGSSDRESLIRAIANFPVEPLPAVQDQFRRIMLAELDPPTWSSPDAPLLQARIDALLARGAVEEAEALLQRTNSQEPELFRRAFDVGLLTGREQAACAHMRAVPGISPSFPVRIFCLARTGDWPAAALTLESAKALGQLTPEEDALLAQFLDPELSELLPPTAAPARPSPLSFRMLEAIGAAMPTTALPLAFAHSDLRPTAGWKARVEAGERLARAGALPPDVLIAIYGERQPAASGGVWDRVSAVQALKEALNARDAQAVAEALPLAWERMSAAGLGLPFARALGPDVLALEPMASDPLALRLGLLSDAYESVALDATSVPEALSFAASIASGQVDKTPDDALSRAIAAAFSSPIPNLPRELTAFLDEQRLGEAVLSALRSLASGADSEPGDLSGALAFLRAIGLEDTARRAALQILLLEPTT